MEVMIMGLRLIEIKTETDYEDRILVNPGVRTKMVPKLETEIPASNKTVFTTAAA
jgi:hypothetical protein